MGIPREAAKEEIKSAYRRLALQYHPDRNRDDPDCETRLKEINEAYQILGDEKKRAQYDLMSRQPFRNPVFYEGDLSDDSMVILREFIRDGSSLRGFGGCRWGGFGRSGCRRRSWKS
jgi:molecular chaperone DnaJ